MSTGGQLPTSLSTYNIETLAVIWTLQFISGPLVAFRVYWRIRERKGRPLNHWMWADICLVLTWLIQMVVQILNVLEILNTLQQYQSKEWEYMGTYAGFTATAVFIFLRLAVVLFLIEIFPGRMSTIFAIVGTAMVTVTVLMNWCWFGHCFAQYAGKGISLTDIYTKYCVRANIVNLIYGAPIGVIFDAMAVILPVFPILQLHMTVQKKFYVLSIFALGWLTVAASIVRCILVFKIVTGETEPGLGDNLTRFVGVEVHVGLIAMSLITLWRVIKRRFFGRWHGASVALGDQDFREKDSNNEKSPARSPDVSVLHVTVTSSTTNSIVSPPTTNDFRISRVRDEEC